MNALVVIYFCFGFLFVIYAIFREEMAEKYHVKIPAMVPFFGGIGLGLIIAAAGFLLI